MKDYNWAVNKDKLQRAEKFLSPDATEEQVKEKYISLAGLVREKSEPIETPVEEKKAKKGK